MLSSSCVHESREVLSRSEVGFFKLLLHTLEISRPFNMAVAAFGNTAFSRRTHVFCGPVLESLMQKLRPLL